MVVLAYSHTSFDVSGGRVQRGVQPSLVGVWGYPQHPWEGGWEEAPFDSARDKGLDQVDDGVAVEHLLSLLDVDGAHDPGPVRP